MTSSPSREQRAPSPAKMAALIRSALAQGLKPGEFDVLASPRGLSIRLHPTDNWREEDAESLRVPPTPGHCVYVVGIRGFNLVKIGFSRNVPRRLRELSSGSGMADGLVELFRMPGDTRLERDLHKRFAAQRLFGDWVAASGEDPA
jgi:hypothetical protein